MKDLANGDRATEEYANGIKTGPWRMIKKDCTKWETGYLDGNMVHDWRVRASSGHSADLYCKMLKLPAFLPPWVLEGP